MGTIRISIEAQKKAQGGFVARLALQDETSGAFVMVKGASVVLPADLSIDEPLDDPEYPGQPLTANRVTELAALAPVPREVGIYLHRLLSRGKLGSEWARLRAAPLRLLLHIGPEAALAALHALPWERLRDDAGQFIALQAGAPLARWAEPAAGTPRAVEDWPVRLLIVNGAEPGGAAGGAVRIGADEEMLALERLLATPELRHEVEYDVLEHPSRQQIVDACRQVRPHVLHIIGHAETTPAGGRLLLWQPAQPGRPGASDAWSAADIRTQLQGCAPRLVCINACRSSSAPPGAALLPLASLTQAFLQTGSVATLGMQGEVAGDLACVFAETFYRGLIQDGGSDIDAAVQQARITMAGARSGASVEDDADWAFPVLTRCVAAGEVLPHAPARFVAGDADRFVARLPQRRAAHEAIRCCSTPAKGYSQHLAVIVGGKSCGKTYLAEWAVQACLRAGVAVAGVAFDAQVKVDWLDALRWIRDGVRRPEGVSPLPLAPRQRWPLKPQAWRAFNWALNRRLEGLATFEAPPTDGAGVADLGRALSDSADRSETLVEDTLAAFRDALAASGRLVIKLDQLDGIDRQSLAGPLMEGLIRPIALGHLPDVRLLLVVERSHWEEIRAEFDRIMLRPQVVLVPYFHQGEFDRVARQFCHQWSGKLYPDTVSSEMMRRLVLRGGVEPVEWGAELLKALSQLFHYAAQMQGEAV